MDVSELIRYASDAALAVGDRARVVAWNDEAERLLGYTAGQAIGRHCYDLLQAVLPGGEPLCTPTCDGHACLQRGQSISVPACRARRRDGRWVPLTISTIAAPTGRKGTPGESPASVIFMRPEQGLARQKPWAESVRFYTLGRVGLVIGGQSVAVHDWERKQALTLLKYLIVNYGSAVHRDRLIDVLWPDADEKQGRERLKVTVYSLRRQLAAAGVREEVVERIGEAYALKRGVVWIDSEAFERLANQGADHERRNEISEAIRCFEEAQRLYRGDYFEEEPYADWCAEERARLREVQFETLVRLSEHYAGRRDFAKAAQICRTALVHEPCRERVHLALMQYLVRMGRADWAIAQFHHCERLLAEELGVEPMSELRQLCEKISSSEKINSTTGSRQQI